MTLEDVSFALVNADEIEIAYKIEVAGYPTDEAASLDAFRYRQANAPDLFLGVYRGRSSNSSGELLGYICSTRAYGESLTHSSMSTHVPDGPSVCIHSVCVAPTGRRHGLGVALLREYLTRLDKDATSKGYARVLLITHDELRPFYERAGFEWVGPSVVQHGARQWFEMKRDLVSSGSPASAAAAAALENQLPPNVVPADLLAALSKPAALPGASSRLYASFVRGTDDLITTRSEDKLNKFHLVCPRRGCELVILLKDGATLVQMRSHELEPSERTTHPDLPALPPPPALTHWWQITGGPMAFENIGFTLPVNNAAAPSGRRMKLLACAGCDLGPIGWCEEGGSRYWVHVERVAYRT